MLQALKKISELTREIRQGEGDDLEPLCSHALDVMRNVYDYAVEKQAYQKEAVEFVLQGLHAIVEKTAEGFENVENVEEHAQSLMISIITGYQWDNVENADLALRAIIVWIPKSHVMKTMAILWIEDRLSGMLQRKVIGGLLRAVFSERVSGSLQAAILPLLDILLRNSKDAPDRRSALIEAVLEWLMPDKVLGAKTSILLTTLLRSVMASALSEHLQRDVTEYVVDKLESFILQASEEKHIAALLDFSRASALFLHQDYLADRVSNYLQKFREGLKSNKMTPELKLLQRLAQHLATSQVKQSIQGGLIGSAIQRVLEPQEAQEKGVDKMDISK